MSPSFHYGPQIQTPTVGAFLPRSAVAPRSEVLLQAGGQLFVECFLCSREIANFLLRSTLARYDGHVWKCQLRACKHSKPSQCSRLWRTTFSSRSFSLRPEPHPNIEVSSTSSALGSLPALLASASAAAWTSALSKQLKESAYHHGKAIITNIKTIIMISVTALHCCHNCYLLHPVADLTTVCLL